MNPDRYNDPEKFRIMKKRNAANGSFELINTVHDSLWGSKSLATEEFTNKMLEEFEEYIVASKELANASADTKHYPETSILFIPARSTRMQVNLSSKAFDLGEVYITNKVAFTLNLSTMTVFESAILNHAMGKYGYLENQEDIDRNSVVLHHRKGEFMSSWRLSINDQYLWIITQLFKNNINNKTIVLLAEEYGE